MIFDFIFLILMNLIKYFKKHTIIYYTRNWIINLIGLTFFTCTCSYNITYLYALYCAFPILIQNNLRTKYIFKRSESPKDNFLFIFYQSHFEFILFELQDSKLTITNSLRSISCFWHEIHKFFSICIHYISLLYFCSIRLCLNNEYTNN